MRPEALKEAVDEFERQIKEAIAAGEDPDEAADRIIPRWFYTGHKVIHTFAHPDKRAKWECYACQHQWVSRDGDRCPECGDCKHVWKWVAEPYGPQDRACKYCGTTLEEDMGEEKFTAYIKRERESRDKWQNSQENN
jgi:hypothetical protein